ncbi:Aspergillopepsin-2 [Pseudocercospora fuligena]|uniref:Aspergillopepsin-2 n=1 Tax=Pseudocercospora fuligena TaxID=685502 RepID=A0A8H6VPW0_9PEZI|nr:Aspergillopepsin-2 [Pseudocercospora fuligena]
MKLLTTILAVLMAALAMASPLSKSTTNSLNTTLATTTLMSNLTNKMDKPKQDSTWAGAIQKGRGVTEVRGTINVPHVHGSSPYSGRAWIGLDNAEDGSCSADVRAGIVWSILGNGTTTYNAFWTFNPGKSLLLDAGTLIVEPGDEVVFGIQAKNKYTVDIWMTNQRTGGEYSHTIDGFKKQKNKLCLKQAEWILENPSSGGFEPEIRWQKAAWRHKAEYGSGSVVWVPEEAEVKNIVKDGWQLTTCGLFKEENKDTDADWGMGVQCGCNCSW